MTSGLLGIVLVTAMLAGAALAAIGSVGVACATFVGGSRFFLALALTGLAITILSALTMAGILVAGLWAGAFS